MQVRKALLQDASNIYDLFLGFFGSDGFYFFGSTLHVFTANHSTWSCACHDRQINPKFLREFPRCRRGVHSSTRACGGTNNSGCGTCY